MAGRLPAIGTGRERRKNSCCEPVSSILAFFTIARVSAESRFDPAFRDNTEKTDGDASTHPVYLTSGDLTVTESAFA
jgi:hypothetical protein